MRVVMIGLCLACLSPLALCAPATHFVFSGPSDVIYGTGPAGKYRFFHFTLTAEDASGHVSVDYAGTVHFSDPAGDALLPADGVLPNGSGTFDAGFLTPSNNGSLIATDTADSSITGSGEFSLPVRLQSFDVQ